MSASPLCTLNGAYVLGPEGTHYEAMLSVQRGETVIVPDQETQGKRRLFRVVMGLDRAEPGQVALFGYDLATVNRHTLNQIRSRCAVLPAKTQMVSNLDVFSNVALPLRYHHGGDEVTIRGKVMDALHKLGLEKEAGHRPVQLTTDQQRFVGIARAIVCQPELFLLEDPYEGFNEAQAERAAQMFRALLEQGTGLLISLTQSRSESLASLPNARYQPLETA